MPQTKAVLQLQLVSYVRGIELMSDYEFKTNKPHLRLLQEHIHRHAKKSGFWECNSGHRMPCQDPICRHINIPEKIALMHSELSEALEEYRKPGIRTNEIYHVMEGKPIRYDSLDNTVPNKPEGLPIELADCVIRI